MESESNLLRQINPELVSEKEGLVKLVFKFEKMTFDVSAKAIRDPRATLPFYRVPYIITFPSGKTLESNLVYDADKRVFIDKMVEDYMMEENFPEEFSKKSSTEDYVWEFKWDSYRLKISEIFSLLFNSGEIFIEEYLPVRQTEK